MDDYSLDAVAREVLGEGKAVDNPYDRMAEIDRMFAEVREAVRAGRARALRTRSR